MIAPTGDLEVLFITDRSPDTDNGYGIRVCNVIAGLQTVGRLHVCLVDSSDVGVTLEETARYTTSVVRAARPSRLRKALSILTTNPVDVRYRRRSALRREIERVSSERQWDVVWCSGAPVHLLSQAIESDGRVVDFYDLNDQLLLTEIRDRAERHGWLRSAPHNVFDLIDAARWWWLQRRICASVDLVSVCSELDVEQLDLPNVKVVPNGYPMPAADSEARTRRSSPTLLFVGPLTYEPNHLAVEWLLSEIMPRIRRAGVPDCELMVVGDDRGVHLSGSDASWAHFHGHVRDVGPFYAQASVAVTPLHSGGGTRLKVIEALARRTPLVSTSFGCQGLGLEPGTDVIVADDPDSFARACIEVITDSALRERLISAGITRYARDLTSEMAAKAVAQAAMDVVAPNRSTTFDYL